MTAKIPSPTRHLIAYVAVVLAGAAALWLIQRHNNDQLRAYQIAECHSANIVRTNQRVVIRSLLVITKILQDRQRAGLRPVPAPLVTKLRRRLTPLSAPYPDRNCDGRVDPR